MSNWKVKVAMYGWTEHPDWTPSLQEVLFWTYEKGENKVGDERSPSQQHRVSEIVEVELIPRSTEQATTDALKVIGKLRAEQITSHVTAMQKLNEAEAKYLCLTHQDGPVVSDWEGSGSNGTMPGEDIGKIPPFARPSNREDKDITF